MKHQLGNHAVVCANKYQWLGVRATAKAVGIDFCDYAARHGFEDWPRLWFTADGAKIIGCAKGGKDIPFDEFIARMLGVWDDDPVIKIGDHTVQFGADGSIKVGCTSVSYDTLKQVYEHATKKQTK